MTPATANLPPDPPRARILIVEDESLIAQAIKDALTDLGHLVVGPVGRLDRALQVADDAALGIDAAILDVNIRGGAVYPVAERLLARHIPFVFASGYSSWALPDAFRDLPRLEKPFRRQDLEAAIDSLLGARDRRSA